MEADFKNKIEIQNANELNKKLLIKYKLSTIYQFMEDNDYDEKERIEDYVLNSIDKDIYDYKMIINDNEIIGAFLIKDYNDGVIIDEIYIIEEYRNKGVGTKILNEIIENNKIIYLWVYKKNKKAIKLYKKLGFKVVDDTETRYFMKYKEE